MATNGSVEQSGSPNGEISVETASTQDPTTTVEVPHSDSAGGVDDYAQVGGDGFHIAVIC